MKILLAPDKFKGSLSAEQVCDALSEGLIKKFPTAEIIRTPLADGGEGTCELLTKSSGGEFRELVVSDPLFRKISARYGINKKTRTAFIEMASASGLELLSKEERNPLFTTTFGTGELIRDAIDQGVNKIILGIGGSATNDAGIGMAEAFGFEFYDKNRKRLKPTGENLFRLDSISKTNIHPALKDTECIALCDVDNPLYGIRGAAFTYGPQKGSDANAIELLDRGLQNFEHVIRKTFSREADFPGAGAGGGIASGAHIFLNSSMRKGIDYLMDELQLEEKIKNADLIITGEGKIDLQTLSGKVVSAVAKRAQLYNKPVIAFCGQCELRLEELKKVGITEMISLVDPFTTKEEAIKNAYHLMASAITNLDLAS